MTAPLGLRPLPLTAHLPVTSTALQPEFWLAELNAAVPRRLFAREAVRDIQQLATLARILLSAPPSVGVDGQDAQKASDVQASRVGRAVSALLDNVLWPDLLATNPEVLHPVLAMMHWRRRAGWDVGPDQLEPVRRVLRAGYLEENEWTPMHMLDLAVHLRGLGLPCPVPPLKALERTILAAPTPPWIWCYEKITVLHYLLRSAAAGGLPIPAAWQRTTAALVIGAVGGHDLHALSSHALAYALTPGPDPRLLMLALERGQALAAQATQTQTEQAQSAQVQPTNRTLADPWQRPNSAAHLAVSAAILQTLPLSQPEVSP